MGGIENNLKLAACNLRDMFQMMHLPELLFLDHIFQLSFGLPSRLPDELVNQMPSMSMK